MRLIIMTVCVLLAGAAEASPMPIDYIFTGTADLTLNERSFTATHFRIIAYGYTGNVIDAGGGDLSNDVTGVVYAGGTISTLLPITRVSSFAGLISLRQPSGGTISGMSAGLAGYALDGPIGPTALAFADGSGDFMAKGHKTLQFTNVGGLSFAATPIPAALPLLATGLLGGGAAIWRRRPKLQQVGSRQ